MTFYVQIDVWHEKWHNFIVIPTATFLFHSLIQKDHFMVFKISNILRDCSSIFPHIIRITSSTNGVSNRLGRWLMNRRQKCWPESSGQSIEFVFLRSPLNAVWPMTKPKLTISGSKSDLPLKCVKKIVFATLLWLWTVNTINISSTKVSIVYSR